MSRWPRGTPVSTKVVTNFADKRRSLGRFARRLKPQSYYYYYDSILFWHIIIDHASMKAMNCLAFQHFPVCNDFLIPLWYYVSITVNTKTKLKSMVWVHERTIPTERPPLVGEMSANFCGYRVPRQHDRSLWPYSRVSRQEPLLFYQVAPQFVLTRLSGPRSRPITFFSC
jgi:hypothetical protein